MNLLIYAVAAIVFLVLVFGMVRRDRAPEADECLAENRSVPRIDNGRWLELSERIFDSSDVRWLEEELAFPRLARCLQLGRKRLAIRWLEALQASFDDLVRTPEIVADGAQGLSGLGGWQMLWLALRFKLMISYAMLVVKVFGPYHRLIPSLSWVPSLQGRSFRRPALASSRASH
jgi:hypothetical protein